MEQQGLHYTFARNNYFTLTNDEKEKADLLNYN